jgi:cupin 2 domain-containing protein
MELENLFERLPDDRSVEFLETLAQGGCFRLERIVSFGQATEPGKWYDQAQDEWVALLSGSAILRFEKKSDSIEMGPGDFVLIPAHCRHRVEATDTQKPSIWLAIHFEE